MATQKPASEPATFATSLKATTAQPTRAKEAQKQGKSGVLTSTPAPVADPTTNPLYLELGDIGTKEKSIEPPALEKEKYAHLLRCREVQRRVRPGASITQLAQQASLALKDAISNIPGPTNKLVAEAVLGATDQFEGLLIKQRKEIVAKHPNGCSEESYKRRRKRVLLDIIRFLERQTLDVPILSAPYGPTVTETETNTADRDPVDSALWALAANASQLHYAGLASFFVSKFSSKLAANRVHYLGWHRYASAESTFEFYWLLYIGWYRPLTLYEPLDPLSRESIAIKRSIDTHQTLAFLLQTIVEQSPFNYSHDLLLHQHGGGIGGIAMSESGEIRDLYATVWLPWFSKSINHRDSTAPSALEIITAKSGAIALIIGNQVGFGDYPALSTARTMAHHSIAHHFNFDEWTPIVDGKSLRQHADAYFDSASTELANSDIVWYYNGNDM